MDRKHRRFHLDDDHVELAVRAKRAVPRGSHWDSITPRGKPELLGKNGMAASRSAATAQMPAHADITRRLTGMFTSQGVPAPIRLTSNSDGPTSQTLAIPNSYDGSPYRAR